MEQLFYNISQILGTTIIHSLWQGLLIYGALQLIFVVVLGLSAEKKHNIAMLALFSMVGWFGYTFYTEFTNFNWNPEVSNYKLSDSLSLSLYNTYAATPMQHTTFENYKIEFFNAIKTYLPYIAILYTTGLVINLIKLCASWNQIRVIKKALTPNLALQAQVNDLTRKLGIRKTVHLNFSTRVDVPCVIGFIKPILLLPVTITTQLNADEVEAILMHELSHIQSNDYLLNVIQQVITVLLFFNPFVILINRIISTERENRCDDIVVQTTGDPLIYAQALLKLEEQRQTNLKLALAATGKKYHLLTRIERIMKTKKPAGNFKHIVLAMVIMAGSLGSISWLNPEIKNGKVVLKRTAAKVLTTTTTTETVVSNHSSQPAAPKSKRHFTIVADDSTHLLQLVDTTKKKKNNIKIVLEDENGVKKEYNSVKELPVDARKEFLSENLNINTDLNLNLNMDTARFADVARNFKFKFNNDFNTDELRKMNAKFREQNAKELGKMRKIRKELNEKELVRMRKFGKEFNATQLERMKSLQKKSDDLSKMYDSPEWRKNIENITKASTDYADKFTKSQDWQKGLQELTSQSMKFSQDFINSPEWKKYQDEIVKQSLEVAKMSRGNVEQREKAREMADKIRESTRELKTRMNLRRGAKDKPEKPEKAEKPEAAEKPERPETPEIPTPPNQ